MGKYYEEKARSIKVIFNNVNRVENILKRKYNLGNVERFKKVYTEPNRTEWELKEVKENVKLTKEMNLEKRRRVR